MIQPTLPERYKSQEDSDFIVYEIPLVDGEGTNYGLVSYVRMGNPNNDTLNKIILEGIQEHYPLSVLSQTKYNTKQANPDQFPVYEKYARLFMGVKNLAKQDALCPVVYITNGLPIFLDVYNPIEGLVYDEYYHFASENQQAFVNACDEENNNFATYNSFIR